MPFAEPHPNDTNCLAVILAAGQGKRMKSALAKPLHRVAGLPMLGHCVEAARQAGARDIAVVAPPAHDDFRKALDGQEPPASFHVQAEQLGTAHAVLAARERLAQATGDVLVLYGDTPLVRPETLNALRSQLAAGAAVAVLGFEASDPTGYGRLITSGDALLEIVEHKDATEAQRAVTLCNSGLMAFRANVLLQLLERVGNENASGEYYLTDAVSLAHAMGLRVSYAVAPDASEVLGVNDREQLATAEAAMQQRLRKAAMLGGATLVDPGTVTLSHDTQLGQDVLIEPHVVFGPGVSVASNVTIKAFSHIEGAAIESGATVGPFARLRPGTQLGERVRVGNFVEIKQASIEAGAKINHLSYVGDARVGAEANIGAGTITCNYDGFEKHRTEIGAGAFVGSNTCLVAPVRLGDGAYIGSGSVITKDVEGDSLALTRGPLVTRAAWPSRQRARRAKGPVSD